MREDPPAEPSGRARWGRRARDLTWWLLLPGILIVAAVLRRGFHLLAEPYETSVPEALVLDGARRVAEGRALYGHLGVLPFVVHVYNPLMYVVPGWASRLLGLDLERTLWLGRTISFASSLALSAVLAGFVWKSTGSRRAGALALAGPFVFHASILTDFYRLHPESEGLLFTILGVALTFGRRAWSLGAAALCFFIAFAFKQSFVAAPVGTLLHLVVSRRRHDAVVFATTLGVLLVVFFTGMGAATRGAYFEDTFLALACNDVSLRYGLSQMGKSCVASWALLLAALPAAVVVASTRRYRVLFAYLAVLASWSVYSAGKYGAGLNYFAELWLLLFLFAALAAGERAARWLPQTAVIVALAAHVGLHAGRLSDADLGLFAFSRSDPYVQHFAAHAGPRLILGDRVAVHVGDPEVLDCMLLDELVRKGVIDPAPLLERIRSGYYALVAVPQNPPWAVQTLILKAAASGPYERVWEAESWNSWTVFERAGEAGPRHEGERANGVERR
ncbi:MAG: hypothetical protein U0167_11005 [bacterium]